MATRTTTEAQRLMAIGDQSSLSYGRYLDIVVFSELELII